MVDIKGGLPQPGLLAGHFPDIGQQARTVVGKGNAAVDAGKQLHPQFLLQPGHHLADAGLCVVQCIGGLGKTACFAHF